MGILSPIRSISLMGRSQPKRGHARCSLTRSAGRCRPCRLPAYAVVNVAVDFYRRNTMTKTETNLEQAIIGEAKARLDYTAFAMQAMQEGHPEVAQLFLEAAGAEAIHGISHLRVAGGVGSTRENLDEAANGEDYELAEMY